MHRSDRIRRREAAKGQSALHARRRGVLLDLAARYADLVAAADEVLAAAGLTGEGAPVMRAGAAPDADAAYYERLETGARWLASRTSSQEERDEHLGMANRYARLRLEAAGERR
ncbi:MAG: hypothetical protein QOH81_2962 [Sphingomonadales bacterium]|jgi:hypothetical protein|nr:hypothetical protein [Sphingomonadales bacterium]